MSRMICVRARVCYSDLTDEYLSSPLGVADCMCCAAAQPSTSMRRQSVESSNKSNSSSAFSVFSIDRRWVTSKDFCGAQ